MRYAAICYVPPKFGHPAEFLQNIRAYDPGAPLYVMSDGPYPDVIPCLNPEVVQKNPRFRYWVANHIFLQALLLAMEKQLDYFFFVESDSRVRGDGWLRLLFDEWFSYPGTVVFGSPCAYNIAKSGHAIPTIITNYAHDYYKASQTPMRVYGHWPGMHFFANGSLSGYHTKTCAEIMRPLNFEKDINAAAMINTPYDAHLGRSLSQRYGLEMLRVFAPSVLSYSGFGEKVYNENQRIEMLTSGSKIAIHPCKTAWIPPL
jgi:hypothetical protein